MQPIKQKGIKSIVKKVSFNNLCKFCGIYFILTYDSAFIIKHKKYKHTQLIRLRLSLLNPCSCSTFQTLPFLFNISCCEFPLFNCSLTTHPPIFVTYSFIKFLFGNSRSFGKPFMYNILEHTHCNGFVLFR